VTASAAKSSATENEYLIQLYMLLREGRPVVGARIAERMGVSPPAVTQAIKRLEQHGLAVLDPTDGVRLTRQGRTQAERTIRRHYLLERLLVDELGFDWADVDEEADRLEHSLSPRLEEHLFERLGRPTTCPHGNPFPGSRDERRLLEARRLTEVQAGEATTILRVTEEAEENTDLMNLLLGHRLMPGAAIKLLRVSDTEIELEREGGHGPVLISQELARFIRVEEPADPLDN
jgi:DtxR family Mn-dependent transcriptional regulator